MSLEIYLAYVLACAVIAVVPGPTVSVIIANSLSHGSRAGLLNVAGTQLGLGLMMAILAVGLSSVIAAMGWLFEWLRWAGAAYLVYLGWKLLRSPDIADAAKPTFVPRGHDRSAASPPALSHLRLSSSRASRRSSPA